MGLGFSKIPAGMKVTYYDIPALGEPIRMLLELSGKSWEDNRIGFKDWPEIKPTTKWGNIPMINAPDGQELHQTKAMVRFLASQVAVTGFAPLYPSKDPVTCFKIDEVIEVMEDVRGKLVPTFSIKDQAEKEAARAALLADDGAVTVLLSRLEANTPEGGNMVSYGTLGAAFTVADLWVFFFLNFLRCGFWDGLPVDYLSVEKYPKLNAVVNKFGAIPAINKYYTKMAEAKPMYKVFAGL